MNPCVPLPVFRSPRLTSLPRSDALNSSRCSPDSSASPIVPFSRSSHAPASSAICSPLSPSSVSPPVGLPSLPPPASPCSIASVRPSLGDHAAIHSAKGVHGTIAITLDRVTQQPTVFPSLPPLSPLSPVSNPALSNPSGTPAVSPSRTIDAFYEGLDDWSALPQHTPSVSDPALSNPSDAPPVSNPALSNPSDAPPVSNPALSNPSGTPAVSPSRTIDAFYEGLDDWSALPQHTPDYSMGPPHH